MSQETTNYFGYGLLADPEAVFTAIGGEAPYREIGALGEQLVILGEEHLPTDKSPNLGGRSVADIILPNWKGSGQDFKSYDLAIGVPTAYTKGILLELTRDQLDAIRDLEFVPMWQREREVRLTQGQRAITFSTQSGRKIVGESTNGSDYNPFLMGKEAAMAAIQGFREDYELRAK